ncbi:MAG: hypothetical protein S4CHLAM20_01120 [Chlamydiia bacterium]|nr:hypothetical protein [Chlamydiia bacterium]
MKVLVVGGTGDIGKAVVKSLKTHDCEVIVAGHSSGDIQVDITNSESIKEMYKSVPSLDALICTPGGKIPLKTVDEMTKQDFLDGMASKLFGQLDLVLTGMHYLNDGGSFTLTTGILNIELIPKGSCIATINSGIEGFVSSASLELPKNLRVNAVSPKLLESSAEKYKTALKGFEAVPDSSIANLYLKSIFGILNGKTIYLS